MQLHCGAAKEVDDPAEFRQNLTQVTQVRLSEKIEEHPEYHILVRTIHILIEMF